MGVRPTEPFTLSRFRVKGHRSFINTEPMMLLNHKHNRVDTHLQIVQMNNVISNDTEHTRVCMPHRHSSPQTM